MKPMQPGMFALALVLAGPIALSACQTAAEKPAAAPAPATAPAAPPAPAVSAPPEAPPTPAAVVNMVTNCFSCHGPDGRSPGAIPSMTGMNAQQALFMLRGFKSGNIPSTVMGRHAKGYSDAELEAIANYMAANLK